MFRRIRTFKRPSKSFKKNKNRDRNDDDDEEEEEEVAPRQVSQEYDLPQTQAASSDNGQSVITIGDSAYKKNIDITVANIPEGIAILGSSAFANCVNLKEVNLPASLKEISFNCFFKKLCPVFARNTFVIREH